MPDSTRSGRKSPRHPRFDYRTHAAYFVTICTHHRQHLFGRVVDASMRLSLFGKIAAAEWIRSGSIRDEVVLDAWVIMPDHMHGIVCLVPSGTTQVSPRGYRLRLETHDPSSFREENRSLRSGVNGPVRYGRSLGSMIAGFKSAVTTRINRIRQTPGSPVWQPRYHDRILRDERAWRACRHYIRQNPARWTHRHP